MLSETEAPGVKARLTADWLTPALRATSREVAIDVGAPSSGAPAPLQRASIRAVVSGSKRWQMPAGTEMETWSPIPAR